MFIFEQGAVISDQNTNIQMNLAQLVQPENIDEDEEQSSVIWSKFVTSQRRFAGSS